MVGGRPNLQSFAVFIKTLIPQQLCARCAQFHSETTEHTATPKCLVSDKFNTAATGSACPPAWLRFNIYAYAPRTMVIPKQVYFLAGRLPRAI